MSMPILPLDSLCMDLDVYDERIIRACFTTRGVKNGAKLRATKPFKTVKTSEQGIVNYVWRMLCFDLVGHGKHACMPVTADFDLSMAQEIFDGGRLHYGQDGWREQMDRGRVLHLEVNDLISRFEANIPKEAFGGIIRWGKALGMI